MLAVYIYTVLSTATVDYYIRLPDKPNRLNKYTQSNALVLFPFPKPVFNFIVSDNRTHARIIYVWNNIFKYTIIVIHIIIMYLYILCVSVRVCVYNTRFVNPISINVVLILLRDNLQRMYIIYIYSDRPIYNIYMHTICDGESRGKTNS